MNIQDRVWRIGALVGVLLAVFLVAISIKEFKSIGYVGADIPNIDTISVSGTGDAVAKPDIATFSFTVTKTAKTVAAAQSQASDKIDAALKAVKAGGVAD